MSLLKNFVEPETMVCSDSAISDAGVLLLNEVQDERLAPMPVSDPNLPEMYAASYHGSCAIAEDKAVTFVASGYLPVINVPTIRDLRSSEVKKILRLGQEKFRNMRQYALFLIAFTDYMACVCNNGFLFNLFKNKGDDNRKLTVILRSLDAQWRRFFRLLQPSHMHSDQVASTVKLFCNAVQGLMGAAHKACFEESLRASKGVLSSAAFKRKDDFERNRAEKRANKQNLTLTKNSREIIKIESGVPVQSDRKVLSPKPKKSAAYDIKHYMFSKPNVAESTSFSSVASGQVVKEVAEDIVNAAMENILKEHEITLKTLLRESNAVGCPPLTVEVLKNSSKVNKPETEMKPIRKEAAVRGPLKENKSEGLCETATDAIVMDNDLSKAQISVVSMSRLLAAPHQVANNRQVSIGDSLPSPLSDIESPRQVTKKLSNWLARTLDIRTLDGGSQVVVESIDLCSPTNQPRNDKTALVSSKRGQVSLLSNWLTRTLDIRTLDGGSQVVVESVDLRSPTNQPQDDKTPSVSSKRERVSLLSNGLTQILDIRTLDGGSQVVVESVDLCSPTNQPRDDETASLSSEREQISLPDTLKPVDKVTKRNVNAFEFMMNRAKQCKSSQPNNKF